MTKKFFSLLLLVSFLSATNYHLTIPLFNQTANNAQNVLNGQNDPNAFDEVSTSNPSPLGGEGKGEGDNDLMTQLPNDPNFEDEVYKIERGDVLEILILGEEELARTLMVMHNGTLSFPLIGEVKVSGLTTEQAGELIAQKLKKYFTHPVVSIILKSPTLPYVSVFGEVLKQGAVEYQRGLRVTDYISLAGGPKGSANLNRVKVVRFYEGTPVVTTVNVSEIIEKGFTKENYELKSGDWLHIPKKFTINWGVILQLTTLALTAVNLYITIDRLQN
jgi:polysaccharide export outer membrane protein